MSATLTLKNIPAPVYERLKLSAQANRRSLNRTQAFNMLSIE